MSDQQGEGLPQKPQISFAEFMGRLLNKSSVHEQVTGSVTLMVDGYFVTGEISSQVDFHLAQLEMEHKDDDSVPSTIRKSNVRDILENGGDYITDQAVLRNVVIHKDQKEIRIDWWTVRISAITGWCNGRISFTPVKS